MSQDWERRLAAIKSRRERAGLTQLELADLAEVAESTVQNLEGTRTYTTTPRSLAAVEQALDRANDKDGLSPQPATAPDESPRGSGFEHVPLRIRHELKDSEIADHDIIDLSDSGMRMVVVITHSPGAEAPTGDQMRRGLQEWSRVQRQLRRITARPESDVPSEF